MHTRGNHGRDRRARPLMPRADATATDIDLMQQMPRPRPLPPTHALHHQPPLWQHQTHGIRTARAEELHVSLHDQGHAHTPALLGRASSATQQQQRHRPTDPPRGRPAHQATRATTLHHHRLGRGAPNALDHFSSAARSRRASRSSGPTPRTPIACFPTASRTPRSTCTPRSVTDRGRRRPSAEPCALTNNPPDRNRDTT